MRLKKKIMFILICIILLLVLFLIGTSIMESKKPENKYPKLDIYEAIMECEVYNEPDHGSIYKYYIYNNDGDYFYVYVHEEITIKGSNEDVIERGDITSIDDFNDFEKKLKSHMKKDSRLIYTYKSGDAYQTFDDLKEFKKYFGKVK